MRKRKIILLILTICFSFQCYSDVVLPSNEECCSDIVFHLREQNKILSELTISTQNSTLAIDKIEAQLQSLPKDNSDTRSFWGSLLGALLSAIVAIAIFWGSHLLDKRKERNKKRSLLESIYLFLNKMQDKCNKAISILQKYKESVDAEPWTHGKFQIMPLDDIKRLKEMPLDMVADSFFEFKINPDKYVEFYSALDFFYTLLNNMEKDYFKFSHDVVTTLSNEILTLNEPLLTNVLQYGDIIRGVGFEALYKKIDQLILDYYKEQPNNKTNINHINEKFIAPLTALCKEMQDNGIDNAIPIPENEILIPLKRMRSLYKTITEENKKFATELLSKTQDLEQCKRYFQEINNEIKPHIDKKENNADEEASHNE